MSYVMVCPGLAGFTVTGQDTAPKGYFLKSYDPEAHNGRGEAEWTIDLAEAMRFPSQTDGLRLWTAVPQARPRRPDGKPNRPLAAFTVSVDPESDYAS